MIHTTNSFLDDDELISMFAIDLQPQLQRSRLFKLNISNGLVELLGSKGNMLAFRKPTQGKDRVLVRLDVDLTLDIAGRLHKLGFTQCLQSTKTGFNEFQPVIPAPDGYTQKCDPISTIWRAWWPIAKKMLDGRTAVIVFYEDRWLEVQKIEIGVNPTVYTKSPELEISTLAALPWAIDTQYLKMQKVQVDAPVPLLPLNCADERSWLRETAASKQSATMSQTLQEIRTNGERWLTTINSLQDDLSGVGAEPSVVRQHKSQLVKTLAYLLTLSKEQI